MTRHGSRRALKACRFCRQRKMKCDNKQPSCNACNFHGKHCVYDELPKRPRSVTLLRKLVLSRDHRIAVIIVVGKLCITSLTFVISLDYKCGLLKPAAMNGLLQKALFMISLIPRSGSP
ncbi:hypothetical protein BGW36DRAFT_218138 [Talaromyces proteolyticus]|uniref:Zn(2)-C6 fungal-type domain-containing protein n=1 Tax=Talaromyces proteolyticus TaxID=1131652 RepID=A0AAD4PYM9_9EURO|nr:uncharacterized protein BGW36DRAFT_218138 [Talaromyces proteolyticus]KAH8694226.1 hypothetical protein BGW36DRAFT_218138 [Talaromyces proteolyticus]